MTDRLKSVRRMVRVQEQLKRLAEWELTAAEERKGEIENAERLLDAFIGEGAPSARLVSVAIGQRRTLSLRRAAADRALAAQAEVTLEARSRFKLAERMAEDLGREERRLDERKDLERLLETIAGRDKDPDASLR